MEDFQFNFGWAEGWSAGLHCSDQAHWDGVCVSPTPIKWDRGTDRGIIDRREKGNSLSLSHYWKRKSKRRSGRREEKWRRRAAIICNIGLTHMHMCTHTDQILSMYFWDESRYEIVWNICFQTCIPYDMLCFSATAGKDTGTHPDQVTRLSQDTHQSLTSRGIHDPNGQ